MCVDGVGVKSVLSISALGIPWQLLVARAVCVVCLLVSVCVFLYVCAACACAKRVSLRLLNKHPGRARLTTLTSGARIVCYVCTPTVVLCTGLPRAIITERILLYTHYVVYTIQHTA